ncbi:hypothetical protein MMC11_005635 [Xylographa trunciseda]|nr:hypothetical protein [Xylographa trunciseda]
MTEKEPFVLYEDKPRLLSYAHKKYAIFILVAIAAIINLQWFWQLQRGTNILNRPPHDIEKEFLWDDCARLEVPLDWNETVAGESDKVAIAIIKKPAKVEVTDPRYAGVILFNPGGPGGSGVVFLRSTAVAFQALLDSSPQSTSQLNVDIEDEKYFDLLSWDPRGVGNTTPGHGCIPDPIARRNWLSQNSAIGFSLRDEDVFRNVYSRGRLLGQTCANTDGANTMNRVNGGEHLGQYIGTANLLGQTFASLQPHRVQRMVLDGVVDGADYATNGWLKNLLDIDGITTAFAATCFRAGPVLCAAHDPRGPSAILENLSTVLASIRADPLPAFHNHIPTTITHSDVVLFLFSLWYSPLYGFPIAASAIHQLAARNGTALAAVKDTYVGHVCDLPAARERDTSAAQIAILCTDGDGFARGDIATPAAFRAYVARLRAQSPLFHERWAQVRLPCAGFGVRAKWRFEGPFGAQTAHPIVFTSQSLDPVTPLPNAVQATGIFPGSVVLETKGLGHCATSMPSVEGMLALREYFRSGAVPPNGTRYEVYMGPFGEKGPVVRTEAERRVADAGMQLARTFFEETKDRLWKF